MATKKKKKKSSRPEVPHVNLTAPSEMDAPKYEPMSLQDFEDWTRKAYDLQLGYAPQVTEAQKQAQTTLFRNMAELQREQGPAFAARADQILQAYAPEFKHQYKYQQDNLARALADVRTQRGDVDVLGTNVTEDLASKYDLGPGLSREIEQAIRGAQTSRGNILGAAPTAQEAFGVGKASIDLYNQRLGQYNQYLGQRAGVTGSQLQATGAVQNYLQGRNPMDMMGQIAGNFMGQNYYPSQAYVDTGLGNQAMGQVGQQQSAYNSAVQQGYSSFQGALQNYNANQIEGTFGTYDRAADYWQYDEAIRRGLYSTPQVSGGGGGMGGMGGMMGAAGGAIGTGMMGLAASGIIGTGATAAGVGIAGAAAGAAAAICWLGRRCIPDRWEEFQHYLFTDAPEKLRRLYLYNARRLAREISDDEATKIGILMHDCINLRTQS